MYFLGAYAAVTYYTYMNSVIQIRSIITLTERTFVLTRTPSQLVEYEAKMVGHDIIVNLIASNLEILVVTITKAIMCTAIVQLLNNAHQSIHLSLEDDQHN